MNHFDCNQNAFSHFHRCSGEICQKANGYFSGLRYGSNFGVPSVRPVERELVQRCEYLCKYLSNDELLVKSFVHTYMQQIDR